MPRPWRSGPKPRPAAELRSERVTIRLRPALAARLADEAGDRKLARYCADLVERRRPVVLPTINRQDWARLAPMSANLNQLAHAANSGRVIGGDDLRQILDETRGLLADVRLLLLGGMPANDHDEDDE